MAVWVRQWWDASLDVRRRRGQRGGIYRAYIPDTLLDRPLTLGGEIAHRAVEVERSVRELSVVSGAAGLEGLTRRQLTPSALLPISLVLLTQRNEYIDRLMDYRYDGASTGPLATDAVGRWVELFLEASATAVEQAKSFSIELMALRERWESQILEERAARGVSRRPRSDAGVTRLLDKLAEAPVMTAQTAAGVLDVADGQARKALDELSAAKVLTRQKLNRQTTGYYSAEVFDLLTFTERALASTRWDTRESAPARAVPARPQ